MGKSKKAKAPSQKTVGGDAMANIAIRHLQANANLKSVFISSDGIAFATENDVINHVKTLRDTTWLEVNRDMASALVEVSEDGNIAVAPLPSNEVKKEDASTSKDKVNE